MTIPSSSIYRVVLPALVILSIPLIAMQFTEEVNWDLSDFIIMGIMILVLGTIIEFARIKWSNKKYLPWIITIAIAIFLFLWAEMAVGIINSPISGS